MLSRLKQYFFILLAVGAFYFILSHHFIFSDAKTVDFLKKDELNLKYTFFSIANKSPEEIMRIDELRDAGIADILLKRGKASKDRLNAAIRKINDE